MNKIVTVTVNDTVTQTAKQTAVTVTDANSKQEVLDFINAQLVITSNSKS
tara:strand:- start:12 stop:161 length:150 start_codon:yes stop_codon:yes gene_type:complete